MNVTDSIWRNTYAMPGKAALIFNERATSYENVRSLAEKAAARMAGAGVRRGDCVAISASNPLVYVVTFLALMRMGVTATPLHKTTGAERRQVLIERNDVSALVHDFDDPWRSSSRELKYFNARELYEPMAEGERLLKAPVAADADDDTCMICLSSGTTGVPKSIPLTHAAAAFAINVSDAQYGGDARMLMYADLTLAVGILRVMRALAAGGTVILVHSASAKVVFGLAETHQATHLVTTTGMGMSLIKYAEESGRPASPLPHLRSARLMGAAVSPKVAEGVMTYLSPNIEVGYGSTEAGGIALQLSSHRTTQPTSAGRLYPWVDAQVVNEQGEVLPPGSTGILRFRTNSMSKGYLKDPEATAKYFRDGWFYPGDLGKIDRAGFMFLAGRVDELLNLAGRKINPEVIEAVLNAHPAVHESAVVPVPSGNLSMPTLVAAVVVKSPVSEAELISHCSSKLGKGETPGRCVFLMELPKNTGGKVVRKDLLALLQQRSDETAQ